MQYVPTVFVLFVCLASVSVGLPASGMDRWLLTAHHHHHDESSTGVCYKYSLGSPKLPFLCLIIMVMAYFMMFCFIPRFCSLLTGRKPNDGTMFMCASANIIHAQVPKGLHHRLSNTFVCFVRWGRVVRSLFASLGSNCTPIAKRFSLR